MGAFSNYAECYILMAAFALSLTEVWGGAISRKTANTFPASGGDGAKKRAREVPLIVYLK